MWIRFAVGIAVLVAAAVTFAFFVRPEEVQQAAEPSADVSEPRSVRTAERIAEGPQAPQSAPTVATAKPQLDVHDLDPADSFQVDKQGNLVVNEQVRQYIEALLAQGSEEEIYAVEQDLRANLPPAAATQAMLLFDRFKKYEAEAEQLAESFDEPTSEDDALEDLESLRALRAQHFGQDATSMFAKEEAVNRAFVELMRIEGDESLTQEEKERRAAKLRDSIPELAELEERNRLGAELTAEEDNSG